MNHTFTYLLHSTLPSQPLHLPIIILCSNHVCLSKLRQRSSPCITQAYFLNSLYVTNLWYTCNFVESLPFYLTMFSSEPNASRKRSKHTTGLEGESPTIDNPTIAAVKPSMTRRGTARELFPTAIQDNSGSS